MRFHSPTARRNGVGELLDGDGFTPDELAENLREIRLINRGMGWTVMTLGLIERLVGRAVPREFSYLDVATGSADLPLAVLGRARRRGWTVQAMALDYNPAVLAVARRHLAGAPVALHAGDARCLPFADRSVDLVTCALALHHFPPAEAVQVLREVARVARHAWLVVDLERTFAAYAGALALRLVLRSRLTRHDAPASVLRAYTLPELRRLMEEAGLVTATASARFPFRLLACDAGLSPGSMAGGPARQDQAQGPAQRRGSQRPAAGGQGAGHAGS